MALFLRDQGYEAFALKGGYAGWRDAGFPLEPKKVEIGTDVADVCPECGAPLSEHGSVV